VRVAKYHDSAIGLTPAHIIDKFTDVNVDRLIRVREYQLTKRVEVRLGQQDGARGTLGPAFDFDDSDSRVVLAEDLARTVAADVLALHDRHQTWLKWFEIVQRLTDHRTTFDIDQRLRMYVANFSESFAITGRWNNDGDALGGAKGS
jgi:hypothetical protein